MVNFHFNSNQTLDKSSPKYTQQCGLDPIRELFGFCVAFISCFLIASTTERDTSPEYHSLFNVAMSHEHPNIALGNWEQSVLESSWLESLVISRWFLEAISLRVLL
jgi:hypothetical protein